MDGFVTLDTLINVLSEIVHGENLKTEIEILKRAMSDSEKIEKYGINYLLIYS